VHCAQDIAPTVKGLIVSRGSEYLNMVGNFSDGKAESKISGEYCPINGRVAWSQRKPLKGASGGKGAWEVWGSLYATYGNSEQGAAGVQEEDPQIRILATWVDEKGGKGNIELCLASGNPADVSFVVADSFWSALGSQPFVQGGDSDGPDQDLARDWVILPDSSHSISRRDRM